MVPPTATIEQDLEAHRRVLTGFCYRMLGSGSEAEDAVQETMVRAWRGADRFEGRSSLRSWLYRIATNVCLDMVQGPQRRARPVDLGPSSTADAVLAPTRPDHVWIEPIPDGRVLPEGDPADVAVARDTIRLAFVAALQHLPPRQRAVLILREVLRWPASEVAELLDTTVASVNSALQRARATLDAANADADTTRATEIDEGMQDMLDRYVRAFEAYDIATLVALLQEDVAFSMPPYPMWLEGHDEVSKWLLGPGIGCEGSRLVATRANGGPAFGSYRRAGPRRHEPFALQVLEVKDGRVAAWTNFLDTDLFAQFDLPPFLDD